MAGDQQLHDLVGPDSSLFETLLDNLMSASNKQRSNAGLLFKLCEHKYPDSLALKLVRTLKSSPADTRRVMSAVLLREQLTRVRILESTRSTLKSDLIASLQESTKSIAKKLCDTICELASAISEENGWPELLQFILQYIVADVNPNFQEYALLIFSGLPQSVRDNIIPQLSTTLHSVFSQALRSSTSDDVRITALGAAINVIQASDSRQFLDLLLSMVEMLKNAMSSGKEATAQEALKLLIELAGTKPTFLTPKLVEFVDLMLGIAENPNLEEGTRHLAIEFVTTLVEAQKTGQRKTHMHILTKLFSVLMKMLVNN